jgi:hypothetical protein
MGSCGVIIEGMRRGEYIRRNKILRGLLPVTCWRGLGEHETALPSQDLTLSLGIVFSLD